MLTPNNRSGKAQKNMSLGAQGVAFVLGLAYRGKLTQRPFIRWGRGAVLEPNDIPPSALKLHQLDSDTPWNGEE